MQKWTMKTNPNLHVYTMPGGVAFSMAVSKLIGLIINILYSIQKS